MRAMSIAGGNYERSIIPECCDISRFSIGTIAVYPVPGVIHDEPQELPSFTRSYSRYRTRTTSSGKVAGQRPLTRKERIARALAGRDVDRPPFTHWHHFGPQTPEEHAKAILEYHGKYKTDIVKVMSDYPYPKPEGNWYELKVLDNPFPEQIRALELIRDGLHADAYIL